jgi:hypothetical protein
MTATAQGEAPVVSAGSTVTAVVSTATAQAEVPAVSAGSTVTAVAMTATAQAEAPGVTGGATVTAVVMTATAQGEAPAVSGSAAVTAVVMTATAQAEVPLVEVGGTDAEVLAVEMTASATARTPTVSTTTFTFTLPTYNYPAGRDLLFSKIHYRPGYSVVKKDGVYTQARMVPASLLDGADIIYLGGRTYTIPESEYDALLAAGFSAEATEVTY